jgi:hypothetical protein
MRLHDVEQRSPAWYALRLGKPTTSEFGSLVTPTGRPSKSIGPYAARLAAELFVGHQIGWDGSGWTERGRELEDHAVRLYEFARDCAAEKVGFVTDDDDQAGCSPDAFIGADGMMEVKCLKAENHVAAIMHYRETGKCQPDYVPQTQGQLMLTGRAWCDLTFYHPELPLLIVRQTAIPEIAAVLAEQIPAVIAERDRVLATLRTMEN